jgi:5-methylcytosine-specific restriction endonuclease McrA
MPKKRSSAGSSASILELLKQYSEGLDIVEIRQKLNLPGDTPHQQLDRRIRELYRDHNILRKKRGRYTVYKYAGPKDQPATGKPIDKTARARILHRDHSKCQMCGRTAVEDSVKLHIDHKVPQDWGGETEDDNLWVLCSECNEGKRNFFATITDLAVRDAMLHKEIHVRIGELMKAKMGEAIPKNLFQIVAYTHDDWEKRLRELREIGWEYHYIRREEKGHTRVYFILDHWEPWPENPAAAIHEAERRKKTRR